MLAVLKQEGLLREHRGARFQLTPKLRVESLDRLAHAYEERRERDRLKLEGMVIYAQTALCRTRALLDALGERADWEACGTCDNCRGAAIRSTAPAAGAA
jgi:ATP-dependent DNA helicase RecQ